LPAAVLISYEVSSRVGFVDQGLQVLLPLPSQVLADIPRVLHDPVVQAAVFQTATSSVLGFALGMVAAGFTGVLAGMVSRIGMALMPTVHFLRVLPVALYVPLGMILIGLDERLPIALAFFITATYAVIPVESAVSSYDPEKLLFLTARGMSRARIAASFVMPEAVTALGTSVSITVPLAFAVVVVTEMLLPGVGGLGAQIMHAKEFGHYETLWTLACILGVLGFAFHLSATLLVSLLFPWASLGSTSLLVMSRGEGK
jgi:ABC-type nitrate/sulfonate/bicarbonate transport system permease component